MRFRILPSIVVFIGSYLPLSLILLALDFRYELIGQGLCWPFSDQSHGCVLPLRNPQYSVVICLICLACFGISLITLAVTRPIIPIDVGDARYIPAELMSYTLPYVVSFMSLEYHETGKFVGLLIFLGWMFWITHKSGQLILNPLFTAFGWRLYEIGYRFPGEQTERHGRTLVRGILEGGKRYNHTTIQDVLIIRPGDAAEEFRHASS